MFSVPLIPGRHEVILATCLLKKCEILSLTFSVMLLKGFIAGCFRKKKKKKFQYLLVAGAELARIFRLSSGPPACTSPLHPSLAEGACRCAGPLSLSSPAFPCTDGVKKEKFALGKATNTTGELQTARSALHPPLGCKAGVTPGCSDLPYRAAWKL